MARKPKTTEIVEVDPVELNDEQKMIRDLQNSGKLALAAGTLPVIPPDYQFPLRDKEFVLRALHGAFELNGGVPKLMAWGRQNPDKFFPAFLKATLETGDKTTVNATANVMNVVTGVAPSPFDSDTIENGDDDVDG